MNNEASYPSEHPSDLYTVLEIKQALKDIVQHVQRAEWLHQNRDHVYHTICFGLQVDALCFQAIAALLTALPSVHDEYDRWTGLVMDALMRSATLRDHASMAQLYSGLARFYAFTGRINSADIATRNALNHLNDETKQETVVEAHICLVEVLLYHFNHRLTPEQLEKLPDLIRRVRNPLLVARTHLVLARAYTWRGEVEEAISYGLRAFEYFSGIQDEAGVFRSAMTIAKAYRYQRMFANADYYLHIALRCDEKAKLPKDMGDLYYELGAIAYENAHMGNDLRLFHEAEHYYSTALKHYEKTKAPFHYAAVYQALGLLQIRLGHYNEAQGNLELAAESWKRLNNLFEQVQTHYTLSFLEVHRGNLKLARLLAEEALEMAEPLPESPACRELCNDIRAYIERIDSGYYAQ